LLDYIEWEEKAKSMGITVGKLKEKMGKEKKGK